MNFSESKRFFLKSPRISKCENQNWQKHPFVNMSTTRTPSKAPVPDTTYVECSWAFSQHGSVYVRLSPTLAESLHLKRQVHFRRLGHVQKVSFTSKLKSAEAKYSNVFKIEVDTRQDDESQDVDVPPNVVYALKEERFSDFSVDNTCQAMFQNKWRSNKAVIDAHKEAAKGKKLGKAGDWLKKTFKSDVIATQDPAAESPAPAATMTLLAPEAFQFNKGAPRGSNNTAAQRKSKQPIEDSEDDEVEEAATEPPASPDVMTMASQRIHSKCYAFRICVTHVVSFTRFISVYYRCSTTTHQQEKKGSCGG